jgi:hypothetical protein
MTEEMFPFQIKTLETLLDQLRAGVIELTSVQVDYPDYCIDEAYADRPPKVNRGFAAGEIKWRQVKPQEPQGGQPGA